MDTKKTVLFLFFLHAIIRFFIYFCKKSLLLWEKEKKAVNA